MRRLDPKRLTLSRGLLIALGTLSLGAVAGWIQPPPAVIVAVGISGLALLLLGLRTLETPNPCGDPKIRLSRLAQAAKALAHNLAHFDNWWPAVKNEGFDGRLPDGRPTTHPEAMETLLHCFAQFFSTAFTYQEQCRRRKPLESVREVYSALGDDPAGPTDYSLMSTQLHVVGVRSTPGWGTVDARPIQLADFRLELGGDPRFAEDFAPLRRLLLLAAPGTEARSRLEAVEEAARFVEAELKKSYRV